MLQFGLFALGKFAYFYEPLVFARLWTVWSTSWRHATDHGNREGHSFRVRCRRCNSCGYGRLCDHAATLDLANSGSAQIRFIAGVGRHFRSQQRQVRFLQGMASMKGSQVLLLGHLSRSVHPDVERQVSPPMMKSSSSSRARGWRGRWES